MDDFQDVTVVQRVRLVVLARQDVTIQFHCDTPLVQPQLTYQLGYGDRIGKVARLSVDGHAHGENIDASTDLYNLGVIW